MYKSVDESARIEDFGVVNRRGDNLTSGDLILPLRNSDKYWDDIISNMQNHFLKYGEMRVSFDTIPAEYITVFKAQLENARYNSDGAELSFRDRMVYFSQKKVGSSQNPINYYGGDYNPADLVWSVLTVYGGLSGLTDPSNPDIDYNAWLTWKLYMSTCQYKIRGRFTGQTILDILNQVGAITSSTFYTEGDGKIRCVFWIGQDTADIFSYGEDRKEDIVVLDIDRLNMVNRYVIYYGYNPATETWAGNVVVEDLSSQAIYGVLEDVADSDVLWHSIYQSAFDFATRELDETKKPKQECRFNAFLSAFTQQVSDGIKLTDSCHNLTNQGMKVESLSFDVNNMKVVISGYLTTLFHFLILDDTYYGVLDDVNGLM
jgi:hypothetical protein